MDSGSDHIAEGPLSPHVYYHQIEQIENERSKLIAAMHASRQYKPSELGYSPTQNSDNCPTWKPLSNDDLFQAGSEAHRRRRESNTAASTVIFTPTESAIEPEKHDTIDDHRQPPEPHYDKLDDNKAPAINGKVGRSFAWYEQLVIPKNPYQPANNTVTPRNLAMSQGSEQAGHLGKTTNTVKTAQEMHKDESECDIKPATDPHVSHDYSKFQINGMIERMEKSLAQIANVKAALNSMETVFDEQCGNMSTATSTTPPLWMLKSTLECMEEIKAAIPVLEEFTNGLKDPAWEHHNKCALAGVLKQMGLNNKKLHALEE